MDKTVYGLRKDVDNILNGNGELSTIYSIVSNVPIIIYNDDVFSPSTVYFNSYKIKGRLTSLYPATLTLYESTDGVSYTEVKKVIDKTVITYTPSNSSVKYVKCEQADNEGYVLDNQSIAIINSSEMNEGYTILLGNDSHTLSCNNNGAILESQTIDIPFYVYKGVNLVNCPVPILSTLPEGMSLGSSTSCTTSNPGNIKLNVNKDANLGYVTDGVIDLTFSISETTIIKKFSWSKSLKGFDGNNGVDGKDIEFIFKKSSHNIPPNTPTCPYSDNRDNCIPTGWTDTQSGVSAEYPFEFVSKRVRNSIGNWGTFSTPQLWATYSQDGESGAEITEGELEEKLNNIDSINANYLSGHDISQFVLKSDNDTQVINQSGKTGTIHVSRIEPLVIVMIRDWRGTIPSLHNYFNIGATIEESKRPIIYSQFGNNVGDGRIRVATGGVLQHMATTGTPGSSEYILNGTIIYPVSSGGNPTTLVRVNRSDYPVGEYLEYVLYYGTQPVANVPVTIIVNGVSYTKITDSEGKVSKQINLKGGSMTAEARFNGTQDYAPSVRNQELLTVSRVSIDTSYLANIMDGGRIIAFEIVSTTGRRLPFFDFTVEINGRVYNKTTQEMGVATMPISLASGKYPVKFQFDRDKVNGLGQFTGELVVN